MLESAGCVEVAYAFSFKQKQANFLYFNGEKIVVDESFYEK